MTKDQIQEYTLRITRANRSELIVIVYDLAIGYLETAIKSFDAGDLEMFATNSRYANKCVQDLLEALDFDYDPAYPLMRIYVFISKQISLAPIKKDKETLEVALRLLKKLRKSFEDIAAQDNSEPLMENTQDVYAGLTYGRGSLNENVQGAGNRGFTV
ncbi:MAG: flagellar protein FliS [Lachnospiraceae bacterium]|nr:flagellar protein FliS [Lachnospiraceae bacterium]